MTLPRLLRAVPAVVLLVGAGVGGLTLWSAYERHVGALEATIRAREVEIAALKKSARRVDSVYVQVTDTLKVRVTAYHTIRDTVLARLTDTVVAHRIDTVTVRELIHAADSTIAACSAVVLTCRQRVSQRDSIIALQGMQLKALGKRGKLFGLIPLPSRTLTFGLGIVGGYLLRR